MGANEYSKLFATAKETGGGFGTCTKCERHSATSERGLCRVCEYVAQYDPVKAGLKQVAQGIKQLRASDGFVRWPYTTLDHVAGPLPLGQVAYIVAATGIGKTTLSVDMVRRWVTGAPMPNATNVKQYVTRPIGVTVLPLETSPHDWRMAFAANMIGVNHGDVFEMIASFHDGDATHADTLQQLEQAMAVQMTDEILRKHLQIIDDESVTVDNLGRAFALAKAAGHHVVLIDHIDQVGDDEDPLSGRKARGLEAVERVNNAVLQFARAYKMVAICMSQANISVQGDGLNPLMRYRSLELKHVMYSSFKIKNAAQILGVFRPLKPDVTRDEFRLAREGAIDPMEVLHPERMGVNAMKLRHRGRNEQMKVSLAYVNGRVRDLTALEMSEDQRDRMLGDNLTHTSFVPNDKSSETPRERKPKASAPDPAPSYYEKEAPTLDV